MPNASRKHRKKFIRPRRIEVTDEDGWTHVSNTHSVPRPSTTTTRKIMTDGAADDEDIPDNNDKSTTTRLLLAPSEPPPKLTLAELRKQFNTHLETWESSATWQQLKNALLKDILSSQSQLAIENVVCIGLGSPSGFVQGGWVDRRSVAMYQLAALASIIDCVKQHHATSTSTHQETVEMRTIAQDPVFNTLDIELLSSLGITAVDSPEGFNAVTDKTFLFAPGAERRHLKLILPANPVMVFGGPLEEQPPLTARGFNDENDIDEDYGSKCLADFVAQTRSVKLSEFEAKPEAFWRMRVYWREEK